MRIVALIAVLGLNPRKTRNPETPNARGAPARRDAPRYPKTLRAPKWPPTPQPPNPETARRYLRALVMAYDALEKDPAPAINAVMQEMGIPEDWARAIFKEAGLPAIYKQTDPGYRYSAVKGSPLQASLADLARFLVRGEGAPEAGGGERARGRFTDGGGPRHAQDGHEPGRRRQHDTLTFARSGSEVRPWGNEVDR